MRRVVVGLEPWAVYKQFKSRSQPGVGISECWMGCSSTWLLVNSSLAWWETWGWRDLLRAVPERCAPSPAVDVAWDPGMLCLSLPWEPFPNLPFLAAFQSTWFRALGDVKEYFNMGEWEERTSFNLIVWREICLFSVSCLLQIQNSLELLFSP